MNEPSIIVPAYPYEGPLLWLLAPMCHLFASEEQLAADEYTGGSGYYETLYGPAAGRHKHRAACLTILFERIELAPADVTLPDSERYTAGDKYNHPHLGISMSWHDERPREDDELIKRVIQVDAAVQDIFASETSLPKEHDEQLRFLTRVLLQMRVAVAAKAVLLGNSAFGRVFTRMSEILTRYDETISGHREREAWTLAPEVADIFMLDLNIPNVDAFAKLRASKDLNDYARGFRQALGSAQAGGDPGRELRNLMREAMDRKDLSARIMGAFKTIGSIANLAGLIPLVGTVSSAVGIAADATSRVLEASSKERSWYLLGPKMREVSLEDVLRDFQE